MAAMSEMSRIIAIDGPSGSGKTSVSQRVAEKTGFAHVDSGALYRIVTWQCLLHQVDTASESAVAECAHRIEVGFAACPNAIRFLVDSQDPGDEIRVPEINRHASLVAAVKEVRDTVTQWLRSLTSFGDLVVEGRDITSVVFPASPARFYLTASAEARSRRRQLEEVQKGIATQSVEEVRASLLNRDQIDSTRKHAPLRKVEGVLEIDSTNLTLDEVVRTVLAALPPGWQRGVV